MRQTQEFEGKNVDNAIENACSALNIGKKNLVYDVISSGSTGIFGIVGVKKAKIRVTLPEKRDKGGESGYGSSYDSDRAGVMSIVDEAFGKEIKPSIDRPYSENLISAKSDSKQDSILDDVVGQYQDQDKIGEKIESLSIENSVENENLKESVKESDGNKKDLENRKRWAGERPSHPKSKKGRISGRKPPSGKISSEKSSTDEIATTKSTSNELADQTISDDDSNLQSPTEDKLVPRKQGRGKHGASSSEKPEDPKQYSRNKNRPKKRDTWLRADGDDLLNEAMEAMDSAESASTPKVESTPKVDKKRVTHHKKREFPKPNESVKNIELTEKNSSEKENNLTDDNGQYKSEIDDEFLNEDFHGGASEHAGSEEDDAPYIKDDDEIIETYDERDDGYPPKYKGELPVDVSEEAMRVGRDTLQKMIALITDDATVTAQSDEDRLLLKVEGGNSGVLIGRRGQTLEAMQYLTDKIINKFSESRVRLKVDIEGYMETRKANLKTLAYKMADKAKKTGKPATINQMTAQDRRVIHLALKDDPRVRTQSMGDGYYRRLVIFPKKSSFKRRKPFKKI